MRCSSGDSRFVLTGFPATSCHRSVPNANAAETKTARAKQARIARTTERRRPRAARPATSPQSGCASSAS